MLLLAYLVTRSGDWGEARIRVMAGGEETAAGETEETLRRYLEEVRIQAEPEIVREAEALDVAQQSWDAALVFLPFRLSGDQLVNPFGGKIEDLLPHLPVVAMFLAAEDIDLGAAPEQGKAAEIAAALDALKDAERRVRDAEKEAERLAETAERTLQEVRSVSESEVTAEEMASFADLARKARDQARMAARRSAKAKAKAKDAAAAVAALGVTLESAVEASDGSSDSEDS
jgi:hypothetical protein